MPELERLETKLRLARRLHPRKDKQLSPLAQSLLAGSLSSFLERQGVDDTAVPELLRDLAASLKPGTLKSYAPYYTQWLKYCKELSISDTPACAYRIASFLAVSSTDDKTMEPTKKRVAAINFFQEIAGLDPPCKHAIVTRVVSGIKNRLGARGCPTEPISLSSIHAARAKAAQDNATGLLYIADICIVMQEAQLRWDDIADMRLGDIIWSESAVRLLIVDSKTDTRKQGQFGTLSFSRSPDSACQRLLDLIRKGIRAFGQLDHATRSTLLEELATRRSSLPFPRPAASATISLPPDIQSSAARVGLPLENLPLVGTWPWRPRPASLLQSLSYNCFLFHLRKLFAALPNVSCHSLRRGGATQKVAEGMDARLVQWLGRWKRAESFEGYVGSRTNIELATEAIERARAADRGASSSKSPPPAAGSPSVAQHAQAMMHPYRRALL